MEYKDRRLGLTLFGILWILLGLLMGAMALLLLVGFLAGAQGQPGAPPVRLIAPAGLLYIALGVAFITLGIGSIMATRWARALILVLSWFWLITGVLSIFFLFFMLPRMFETLPADQAAMKPVIIGCMSVLFGVMFLLLPGLTVLFYRSPHVKATVEAADPVPRWTDQPLPLLGFEVWMAAGVLGLLYCLISYPSFPIGPYLLSGPALYAIWLVLMAAMLFIAYGAFKRMQAAWWTALGLIVLGIGFVLTFFSRTDFAKWYRDTGLMTDAKQIEMITAMYRGPYFVAWMLIIWGAYLAFLIYLRRYFFGAPPAMPQNADLMTPPST